MAMPVTRYAKSGDVHVAYQILAAGRLIWSLSRASCRTSRTTGTIRIWRAGFFVLPASPVSQCSTSALRPRLRVSVVGPAHGRCSRRHGCRGN